ncbi:hypothetical protein A9G83_000709 [Salmonella enterica subsp. enterica serovar Sundsvall]|nr:hypothetical protein [Salmonella enterica subsp. enterica serovar Sundsvall]
MRMTKEELLSALRLAAKGLPAHTAELVKEAATRLDATSVALCEALEQRTALAAENVALKQFPDQIVSFVAKLGTSEIGSDTREKIESAAKKLKYQATDRLVSELKASIIPEGWKLVPDRMYLEAGDIESICSQCGDGHENGYGEFTGGILWIGELSDDGKFKYGLNIASSECPEEGSVTVCEFDELLREVVQ